MVRYVVSLVFISGVPGVNINTFLGVILGDCGTNPERSATSAFSIVETLSPDIANEVAAAITAFIAVTPDFSEESDMRIIESIVRDAIGTRDVQGRINSQLSPEDWAEIDAEMNGAGVAWLDGGDNTDIHERLQLIAEEFLAENPEHAIRTAIARRAVWDSVEEVDSGGGGLD